MIGKHQFELSAENMARLGMSSSAEATDGGFSPETDGVNLIAVPGAVYAPALPTDKSTNLVGQIIASCEDPAGSAQRLFVSQDAELDGRFFSCDNSGTLTARGSEDTTASTDYIQGRTDIIPYKGEVYVTNSLYIVQWQQPATFNLTFKQFNDSSAPHPALVYEDNAYFADGNEMWRMTSAGGAPAIVLTLPSSQVITALGIDPGSGRMLIATVDQYNVGGTIPSQARVGFYDGFSNKLSRTVIVEEMITAFPSAEGVQYAAYGQNLGYWNGSGVSFLRRFADIAYDQSELLYKHHFTAIGSTLYFIVDRQIIAHGHVIGAKVFYPAFKNLVNSNNLTHICNIGSGLLGMSFSAAKFYTWSTTSVASTNTMALVWNILRAQRPIQLRGVFIEWNDLVTTGTTPVNLTCQNRSVIGSAETYASMGTFTNSSGSSIKETYNEIIGMANPKGRTFKIRSTTDINNFGIVRIIVYYDVAE